MLMGMKSHQVPTCHGCSHQDQNTTDATAQTAVITA